MKIVKKWTPPKRKRKNRPLSRQVSCPSAVLHSPPPLSPAPALQLSAPLPSPLSDFFVPKRPRDRLLLGDSKGTSEHFGFFCFFFGKLWEIKTPPSCFSIPKLKSPKKSHIAIPHNHKNIHHLLIQEILPKAPSFSHTARVYDSHGRPLWV